MSEHCMHGGRLAECADPAAPPIYRSDGWPNCACGGPCEHDGSLARARRFDRALAAEMRVTAAPAGPEPRTDAAVGR